MVVSYSDPFFEKSLPQNPQAERSILGAILLDNAVADEAMLVIAREDFFLDTHRRIFDAMVYLWEKSQPIDLIHLTDVLKRQGNFDTIGGATYIASLIDGVPRTDKIEHYAKLVKAKAMLRRFITAGNQIVAMAFDEEDEPEAIAEKAEALIYSVCDQREMAGFKPVAEIAEVKLEQISALGSRPELITGVPTGFTDFDGMTAGLQKQDLIIIAARPSIGKTALALNMAQYAAKHGHGVGVFSLEMSAGQLVSRLLSSEARVDAHRLRTGYLNREEWARLADALRRLTESCPIQIDDTPGISVPYMRAATRRLKAAMKRQGLSLDLLIIDYLQLMSGRGKTESRQQEVSQISRDLKGLAKELDIPVIALSQLSRQPEQRSDHKPQLSDLRESGAIEQDGDVVCFIHREEVYNKTEENRGVAELIVAKQRNGPTGEIQMAFIRELTRFENMWKDETPQPRPAVGYDYESVDDLPVH